MQHSKPPIWDGSIFVSLMYMNFSYLPVSSLSPSDYQSDSSKMNLKQKKSGTFKSCNGISTVRRSAIFSVGELIKLIVFMCIKYLLDAVKGRAKYSAVIWPEHKYNENIVVEAVEMSH